MPVAQRTQFDAWPNTWWTGFEAVWYTQPPERSPYEFPLTARFSSALTFLKLLAYARCLAGTVPGIAGTIVLYLTTGTGGNGSSLYANSLLTIDPATVLKS